MLGLAVKRNYLGGLGLAPRDSDGIHLDATWALRLILSFPSDFNVQSGELLI